MSWFLNETAAQEGSPGVGVGSEEQLAVFLCP